MSNGSIFRQLANLISYMTLQVLVQAMISPAYYAVCFIYVGFLLLLPWQRAILVWQLFLAFLIGLVIDGFYNSLGIHAFAAVLLVYGRSLLLGLMLPTPRYGLNNRSMISNMGLQRFSVVVLLLVIMHHTAVFVLDTCSCSLGLLVIRKIVLSALLTYLGICFTHGIPTLLARNRSAYVYQ